MSVPQMWAGKKTIYFDVQNISWWKNDDVVKVHAWGGAATEDVSMTVYSGNMLTCQINDDQTKVCFYRYYNSTWNEQTIDKTDAATKNCWTLLTSISGSKYEMSNGYEYEPTAGLMGEMNSWNAGTLSFDGDGNVSVDLTAGDTHQFKILDGTTWYSYNSYGFSTSATDFTLYTGNSECSITASTTGTYHFHWDRTNHTLCIFFPNDYAKARLTKTKYIYFDARNSDASHWNSLNPVAARFYFKYYDSGEDQSNVSVNTPLDGSVLYTNVPNNDYIGRIQINRLSSDKGTQYDDKTSLIHAYSRSSSAQNCIVIPEGQKAAWSPTVEWGTYCPPMSSATLSDNSTNKISWQNAGNDGSTSGKAILVSTSNSIKVQGAATKAVDDANMVINYDFKVDGSSAQAGSSNTYSKGSLSNNMTYTITMDAYNTYNGATGTKLTAGQTLYYKALNTYSVTNTLTNISSNGRSGSDAAAYNIAYTATLSAVTGYKLPATIKIERGSTDITANCSYNSSTGAISIPAGQVSGNITITANGDAKQATITFDKEDGEGGSDGTTATYDAGMTTVTIPHKIGYTFAGYWDGDNGTGNQYYNADGTSYCTWNKDTESATTLYAKWEEDSNEFTNDKGDGNWNDPDNWSAKVVPMNSYAAVQLSGELIVSSYIHVGSMDLTASGAKLTIQAGGTLEVAGAITNTDPDKLVIQTGNEGQGALIYDITQTAPHATVNMTTQYAAGSHYQYIASPIGGVSVADVFSGKGAYTYVWKEGIGWERRGYYDDIAAFEPIALKGKGSCSFVGQLYPGTTSLSLSYTGTPQNSDAQGVNMLANALTAPIKIAAMTITGSPDGSVHVWNDGTWTGSAVASAGEDVIPAMQVYAILANSSGSVSFDYETAVRGASDKNAALKAPKRITSDIPEHLTISVRTNERDIDLQLYEDEMFTNEIDKGWEAIYMEGDGRFGELYAQADEKMSILATPDLEGTILGFAPGETSDYTISFNGDGKGYYLNDMKEQTSTLIAEENTYMFSPDESTNATRFVISRTPIHKVPTGTENVSAGTNARKQMINGVLYIIRDGRIYNAEGALVK